MYLTICPNVGWEIKEKPLTWRCLAHFSLIPHNKPQSPSSPSINPPHSFLAPSGTYQVTPFLVVVLVIRENPVLTIQLLSYPINQPTILRRPEAVIAVAGPFSRYAVQAHLYCYFIHIHFGSSPPRSPHCCATKKTIWFFIETPAMVSRIIFSRVNLCG